MKDNEVILNQAEGSADEVKADIQMQGARRKKERCSEIFFGPHFKETNFSF